MEEAEFIINDILSYTGIITSNPGPEISIGDPDDCKFIDCALESKAQFIVSGDKHLLVLKNVHHIHILNPAEFLSLSGILIKPAT